MGVADTEPLVSVVTPFHNTADYLEDCIRSVIGQSYRNWEYVLVDNCSDDGSSAIARRFAEQDSRIRVVGNDEFLGQVENYNAGMSAISPDSVYTKIVEADNWILPRCIDEMVALSEAHPSVGLVSAYCITETSLRFTGLPPTREVVPGRELARMHFLDYAYLFGAPTTVLFRSDIVRSRQPFFDESTWLVEDLSACYEILRDWDFGFVHQVLTFVRTQNEGSIQSDRWGFFAMALDRLAVLTRHGHDFLEPDEFRRAKRTTEGFYYDRLASGLLTRKGKQFWDYHRSGLAEVGKELRTGKVVGHVILEFLRRATNPGRTLKRLATHN